MDESGGEQGERVGVKAPKGALASALALLRRPDVVGVAGVVFGVAIGMVLGRETAGSGSTSVEPLQGRPAKARKVREEPPEPAVPSHEFRRHLGRHLPKGDAVEGFTPLGLPGRRAAQLTGNEGVLRFGVDPKPGDYALTAIVHLEGSKAGTLQPALDGQMLASSKLEQGWGMYSSPVPPALLSKPQHELALKVDGAGEGAIVAVDSVAIVPVTSEVNLVPNSAGEGNWIEGFSKPSGNTRWSDGPRSVVGVVLAPRAGEYQLVVQGSALWRIAPLTVSAKVNDTDVGTAVFAKKVTESTWKVPAKALRTGLNRIELVFSSTVRPSEVDPASKDKRALALLFSSVSLRPAQ